MARKHPPLRVAALLLLASCAGPASWPDLSEPVAPRDLEPLPETVTRENARDVVRKALQMHRRSETNVHRRFGYVFREQGFVQLYRTNAMDRGNRDEAVRVYVDYAAFQGASSRTMVDTARFKERVELTLTGRFRRWRSAVTPSSAPPALDEEPSTHAAPSLFLLFDDAAAARKLEEALRLLARYDK